MTCQASEYLSRPPEMLVVQGYRHCSNPCPAHGKRAREQARELYLNILGKKAGPVLFREMRAFVETLSLCAACPLKAFPADENHLCRDEAFLLGLIAGIQHADHAAARMCLDQLTCRSRCEEMATAAATLALTLRSYDQKLLPIPLQVVEAMSMREKPALLN